jgi:hypothetical protein
MKAAKPLVLALLLGSLLLLAGQAQAFTIYNHSDHKICISKNFNLIKCHITVENNATFNGEKGAGLDYVWAAWQEGNVCANTYRFSIPKGGFIRIYNQEVKIFEHNKQQKSTVPMTQQKCRN